MRTVRTNKIPGPTLAAALGELADVPGFGIDTEGVLTLGDGVTQEQEAAILAVIAAHDPTAQPPEPEAPRTGTIAAGKPIGRSIYAEAAERNLSLEGVGVDFSAGTLQVEPNTDPQRVAALEALLAAHDPTTPENARIDDLRAIDVDRDRRIGGGYRDATTGKTFQTDEASQQRLTALGAAAGIALALKQSQTFSIIAADNSVVTLTAAEAYALIAGRIMPWVSDMRIHARALKNQVLAGGHPDTSAGWPS